MNPIDLGPTISPFSIVIEQHLTNPPTPMGFAVLTGRQPVAWLTFAQVEAAITRYKEMVSVRVTVSATEKQE